MLRSSSTSRSQANQSAKQSEDLLFVCYMNCLILAEKHKLESIAFPTTANRLFYGYPKLEAAHTAHRAFINYVRQFAKNDSVQHIILVEFSNKDKAIYCESIS